jgi:hypothetical protein
VFLETEPTSGDIEQARHPKRTVDPETRDFAAGFS